MLCHKTKGHVNIESAAESSASALTMQAINDAVESLIIRPILTFELVYLQTIDGLKQSTFRIKLLSETKVRLGAVTFKMFVVVVFFTQLEHRPI